MRIAPSLSTAALSVLGLTLAIGCGDHGTTGNGEPGVTDITGTARSDWLTDTGEQNDIPAGSLPVSAVFQRPDNTWGEIAGTYDPATGDFVIKRVPEGPYYLKIGQAWFFALTARSGIDLGTLRRGRPDGVIVQAKPTNLTLNLTGLTPWQSGDDLELFSLGANAWGSNDAMGGTPPPMNGDTTISSFTLDLSHLGSPGRIEGVKGDKVLLTHLTLRAAGDLPYQALGQALWLPPLTVVDGQPVLSGGAFQDVPQTQVTVDWRRSAFAALAASAGPGATVVLQEMDAWVEPGGDRLSAEAEPALLRIRSAAIADVALDLGYGNPFPAGYRVMGRTSVLYKLAEAASSAPTDLYGSISITGPIDELWKGAVTPQLSPPRGVTIGGSPATSDLTGVGETPVIAWQPPAIGAPTDYWVQISAFEATGSRWVASLYTAEPRVTVPAGVLEKGTSYAVSVSASTLIRDLKEPLRLSAAHADATALTKLFTP